MTWTAIIPLKAPAQRKSRLSAALGAPQREALAEELYRHVMRCVERAGVFETILTLSPSLPPVFARAPEGALRPDVRTKVRLQEGRDLNAEFARARAFLSGPLLVLNADLPLLEPDDLLVLVEAAETAGCALAADRHGTGTNAAALLKGVPFDFAFGPDSLAAHLRSAPQANVLRRTGLACDLDTPADLAHVLASGHTLPDRVESLMRVGQPSATARRIAHAH